MCCALCSVFLGVSFILDEMEGYCFFQSMYVCMSDYVYCHFIQRQHSFFSLTVRHKTEPFNKIKILLIIIHLSTRIKEGITSFLWVTCTIWYHVNSYGCKEWVLANKKNVQWLTDWMKEEWEDETHQDTGNFINQWLFIPQW